MRARMTQSLRQWLGATTVTVLPPFRQARSALRQVTLKTLFLGCCALLGFLYGLVFAVFPPAVMVYLALPVVLLALIVIWALPDFPTGPTRLLGALFFTYTLIIPLWPNYLALTLPGLPWISLRRLTIFPMALIFFICISTSKRFRGSLRGLFDSASMLPGFILALVAIQLLTIPISPTPSGSLNIVLDSVFGAIIPFFVAAWLFQDSGKAFRWQSAMLWSALALCAIGVLEWVNQQVLWAEHIPSFLAVGDEAVQRILEPDFRDGRYRVTTTFTVALAFAEFLAFATPFLLHRLFRSQSVFGLCFWAAADLFLLAIIISTQSRLGMVGWLVAHGFYVCIWAFRRWRFTKGDMLAPALSLMFPVGAFLFFIGMFTVDAIKYRTIGGGSTGLSDDAREQQFDLFWPKLLENPIGYGAGQSGIRLGFRTPEGLYTVDSYFISVGIDYGVVGLIAFFGSIGFAIYALTRIAFDRTFETEDDPLPLATMLLVAVVIRSVLSQTDNLPLIFIALGMAAAFLVRERARASGAEPAEAAHAAATCTWTAARPPGAMASAAQATRRKLVDPAR